MATAVITPSISVLSAVEGIEIDGTAGGVFGPIMIVWFVTIAGLGLVEILHAPRILLALSPWYALRFFLEHGTAGVIVLGAVVLAVTGAEALYADMGHFGRRPIRFVWFGAVLPMPRARHARQARGHDLLLEPRAVPADRTRTHDAVAQTALRAHGA